MAASEGEGLCSAGPLAGEAAGAQGLNQLMKAGGRLDSFAPSHPDAGDADSAVGPLEEAAKLAATKLAVAQDRSQQTGSDAFSRVGPGSPWCDRPHASESGGCPGRAQPRIRRETVPR